MSSNTVIVVGAGVIGASIAYHLASQGAEVLLVDAALPGFGATRHSFGWIGRSPGDVSPAGELRALGRLHWERLRKEVPELDVHWCGAVVWGEFFSGDDAVLSDDAAVREPNLVSPPSRSEFRSDDGWVDATSATESLIRAAQQAGAKVRLGTPVTRLVCADDGTVVGVMLGSETLAASTVVVAAGTGSTALCASAGFVLPMVSSPSVMVRLQAPVGIVTGIVANDLFEARQSRDGMVLMPVDHDGESSMAALMRIGEAAQRLFVESFTGAAETRLVGVDIGWRPMLADGDPSVGYTGVPGLYVAVAHPGVTLASVIGDAVADEILTHETRAEFALFQPR